MNNLLHELDAKLFLFITGLTAKNSSADIFFLTITATGFCLAFFAVLAVYFLRHKHPESSSVWQNFIFRYKELFTIGLSLAVTYAVVQILKMLYGLPRPFLALDSFEPLLVHGAYNSFPSAHAAVFMALAVSVGFFHRLLGYFLLIPALLIGFSRIYVGVHFPIDVIAGFCFGFLIPFSIRWVFKKIFP